ncbi:hypothetical protein SLA_0124 [Streptomyces laurentii]|uniref:Secreted protein n=1 Tax=Streptomyces laurentii TaxID=39478 RepID=A0A161JGM0_STRLU|nr:hypothetical protein SLA_0124 [Streptomyces laurentii]
MNRLKKAAILTSTVTALALPLGLASATAAPATVRACEQNWDLSGSEGYANGCYENGLTKVSGTVHDTKADGRCPFVRAHFTNGGVGDSNWATGKGTKANVSIVAPSGSSVKSLSWEYISC